MKRLALAGLILVAGTIGWVLLRPELGRLITPLHVSVVDLSTVNRGRAHKRPDEWVGLSRDEVVKLATLLAESQVEPQGGCRCPSYLAEGDRRHCRSALDEYRCRKGAAPRPPLDYLLEQSRLNRFGPRPLEPFVAAPGLLIGSCQSLPGQR